MRCADFSAQQGGTAGLRLSLKEDRRFFIGREKYD